MGWFFTVNSKMSSKIPGLGLPLEELSSSQGTPPPFICWTETSPPDIWLNLRRVHYSFLFSSQFSSVRPVYFGDPGSGG